ncbi:rhodanese-like domain-containing protein [Methylovirgula sp. HY1]|uniref:rhodanese-like domain-containing protein n=1 Tax=Methylovirgula sp. HY1 TaxID=2822761 RepID=UPI001C5ABB08|nr:rhodanese-like domain-containing protein [Methylovirgula sp. HY1]QXX74333.1 Thiosulfate sulfurtransferase GlpE [Methylovirgula sp. HY1]
MRRFSILAAALFLAAAAPAPAPEPAGLWQGAMHGATPDRLKGATVLSTAALGALNDRLHPLLIDVAETEKKPASMAKDMPWMPTHRSIPGAVWLANGGGGRTDPAFTDAFKARIATLAGNDMNRPIVVFCHPHCWGSWNAAKRLVTLGYHHVYWYPDGVEGWQSAHDTKVVRPDAAWEKALSNARQGSKRIRQGLNQ